MLIRVAPFVWQAGGDIVDNLQRPSRFTLDEPGARQALDFIHSWQTTHKIVPTHAEYESESLDARFSRGGLGMLLQSRRFTATLRTVPNLDWDVAPLPGQQAAATVLHSDAFCLAKSSPRKEAAYRFTEFVMGTEGSTLLSKTGRTVPSVKSVAEGPAFLDPQNGFEYLRFGYASAMTVAMFILTGLLVGIQIALLRRCGGRQTERLEPRPAGPQVPST